MRLPFIPLAASIGLCAACATGPVPRDQMNSSVASIRAAEAAGATSDPQAAAQLEIARREANRASELIRTGDNRTASLMLDRAEADAELAMALAKEAPLRAEASRAVNDLQSLRQQLR